MATSSITSLLRASDSRGMHCCGDLMKVGYLENLEHHIWEACVEANLMMFVPLASDSRSMPRC